MKFRVVFLAAAALAIASAGSAQVRRGTFEFTPFFGEFFGGNFPRGSNALFADKVDVDDHYTYGGSFGYYLTSAHEFDFRSARSLGCGCLACGSPSRCRRCLTCRPAIPDPLIGSPSA